MDTDIKEIKIPAPEFGMYERVELSWNGERITKIVTIWYEMHKDQWWYKVSNDEEFYPESSFRHLTKEEYESL